MKISKMYNSAIFIVLCCLTFFKPILFWNRFPFNVFFQILQIVIWCIIALVALGRIKSWKPYLTMWTFFCLTNYFVILNNLSDNTLQSLELTTSLFLLVHFLDWSFGQNKSIVPLKCMWNFLYVYELLELITIPLYQKGLINVAWFGIKTRCVDAAIPFILLTLVLKDLLGTKRVLWSITIAISTIFLSMDTTGMVAIILIATGLFLKSKYLEVLLKLIKPLSIVIAPVIITILLLFYQILNRFAWFFSSVLQKDIEMALTLSGRTEFWPNAVTSLSQGTKLVKLFGVGYYNNHEWVYWFRINSLVESHNQILQLLHDTGIIGTATFLIIMYLMFKKNENNINELNQVISIFSFAYFFILVTEIYGYYSYFYIVPLIAANVKNIKMIISNAELQNKRIAIVKYSLKGKRV